ncbi:MAG: phosphatase PAP2 family protein, partial [Stackebrandtia sp.]
MSAASDTAADAPGSEEPSSAGAGWTSSSLRPRSWWPEVLTVLLFGLTTSLLLWPSPLVHMDIAVRDAMETIRLSAPWTQWPVRVVTYTGQGGPLSLICLGLGLWAVYKRRTVRPLFMFVCTWIVLLPVQYFKKLLDRVGPHYPERGQPPYPDADGSVLFVGLDPAQSYPSGHAVNAMVFYGIMILILGPLLSKTWKRVLLIGPAICVLLSQTYLGWHWFWDYPAGLAVGVLIIRATARVPWGT